MEQLIESLIGLQENLERAYNDSKRDICKELGITSDEYDAYMRVVMHNLLSTAGKIREIGLQLKTLQEQAK